jgi:epoxyqueuosine reductase
MRSPKSESQNVPVDMKRKMEKAGILFRSVLYSRLDDVYNSYAELKKDGVIHEKVFNAYLAFFDKDKNAKCPNAVSLFITATPQPQLRITFHTGDRVIQGIIPPTYAQFREREGAEPILKKILDPLGFSFVRGYVPLKRMAVQSGLAEYGRNNLTFITGSGSFYKLAAYFSDFPSVEDFWREPVLADSCKNCSACMKACPTGALAGDRFAVHAEQCLTFVNELTTPFPDWVRPEFHHCLIGCMRCQAICPRNKPFMNLFDDRAEFTIQETDDILSGTPLDKLSEMTQHKLEKSELSGESYATLGRNLKVLINNRAHLI